MAVMYDSINAKAIPSDAQLVAGYINGKYAWSAQDWARFPNAERVTIAVYIPGDSPHAPFNGDVLDVEASDAPRARSFAAQWVQVRRAQGIVPTIYTSKSGLLYLGGLPCDYWIADPSDIPHIVPGSVATQWHYPGSYDVSETTDFWPRKAGDKMPNSSCVAFRLTSSGKGYWLVGADGGVFTYGDAHYWGSVPEQGTHLNTPVIGFDVTPSEAGYCIVTGDYGVFAFGDAPYLGHP